ncbi:MAG: 16S rRNA (cytosine(1402)-N(4))-methyltransferase RsmH [Candidatus Marinimicrobia bacterium]|jgi:16S rRNA (cytosine1402-N4)-methyltransferase|nr:16S rRNA (cytosine(1402)-N(4))-methyltransferase RsmH [Candidatus Neomarinimicrobiota bacterium]MBT4991561.1 16S rRNA (cytosine(1402)-N(4))-methyltransferase RsmH [Candidatus Neomarinimicrobiota bacterium]MBT5355843.1 16S rRNA (cytosine(1402)-N(4))-methyltransferase RsmH [Candidatus Neomarinimicrobiota bacterium]MBT5404660.1 16S rRNA (cytosine(1402)-N(4))-methyltransferase RsmH [Candidatus Neomarinimicrobiota bacterium]MBT6159066.1 16S rRNA (cytosine(1402)-N(4))-methyltransferase RsmH [Candi
MPHIPVMVEEVLSYLNINPAGIYVDGTVGAGGHTIQILNQLNGEGSLIGFDRDHEALAIAKKTIPISSRVSLNCASYHTLPDFLEKHGSNLVNGILLDLGLSSMQLDDEKRGFSFSKKGLLDMRFDQNSDRGASTIINHSSEQELADIMYHFGEERLSRRIAKSIVKQRPIADVEGLFEAIRTATPPQNRNKTLARVFQAFRIAVNGELEKLDHFLSSFIDTLAIGGRIVIMSYHSLEDRRVKHIFRALKRDGRLNVLNKKPVMAQQDEMDTNPRARSAKLRAAERIK